MELETTIRLTEKFVGAPNVAHYFSERDLAAIGRAVKEGAEDDDDSRAKWKSRTQAAMDLALQLQVSKDFPWPGAANVKFPLVTIAALQWHSRAYPVLVNGPELVKMRVIGDDPQGKKRDAAHRVGRYMSYQLLEESDMWEEDTDRALLQTSIVGCAFKKIYRANGRNVSELVPASKLILSYYSKSVSDSPRKTHIIELQRDKIVTRMRTGLFQPAESSKWFTTVPPQTSVEGPTRSDMRLGQTSPGRPDVTRPFEFYEQQVRFDFDDDGYPEPYTITVERVSGEVCRIVANFDWQDIRWVDDKQTQIASIPEQVYFTKYPFIPSPDGGIYDIGYGALLGPINESVDSIINQLIDAGTIANTAGGFLGRGVKIRGGEQSFRPFGWKRVDSTGDDLHKSIVPLPVREPSQVSLHLLQLLVEYANRIGSTQEIMVGGNPGQNTPAQTSQLMAEQGGKINAAVFKRVWRAFKDEFTKLYELKRKFLPITGMGFGEAGELVSRSDFSFPMEDIRPAADPNLVSEAQRIQQAMMVKQQSMTTGGYNKDEVEKALLRALRVENVDQIFPGLEKIPAPPHPKVMVEQMKLQGKAQSDKMKLLEKILPIMAEQGERKARIELIQAQVVDTLTGIGEDQAALELKRFESAVSASQSAEEGLRQWLQLFQGMSNGQPQSGGAPGGAQPPGVPGLAGAPGNPAGPGGAPA